MTKNNDLAYIDENLRIIRERCAEAKDRYRSSDDVIRIMAVTKTVAPEAINHAVELGIDLLGENRVQELLDGVYPGIVFEIAEPPETTHHVEWSHQYWGHIRLRDIRLTLE